MIIYVLHQREGGILLQFIFDDDGACRKIAYRIEEQDGFDIFSYEMLRENIIPGLLTPMRAESNGMDAVQYDVSNLDTLRNYLSFSLSIRQLLSVFSQIISAALALEDYLLDNSLLVTDIGQIYYDREKNEVKMIYFLLLGENGPWRFEEKLFNLFKEIIFSARFIVGDGDRHIAELLNSINDVKNSSLADFKEVVLKLEGLVSHDLGAVTESYENVSGVSDDEPVHNEVRQDCSDMNFMASDSKEAILEYDTGGTDRAESGIFSFVRKLFANAGGGNSHIGSEEESCIIEEAGAGEFLQDKYGNNTVDGETVVLVSGSMGAHTPYLIRSANNERIAINKRVFKVGKDGRYADYIIADNAAVSRAHAEFMIKDGKIYLTDEDSLNNTYINGSALVSRREYEVGEGDVILFADEEFVLHC